MEFKYILKIFVFILILWGTATTLFVFNYSKESMTSMNLLKKEDAFCEYHRGNSSILEGECGKLTQKNCLKTTCCGWASPGKCVAGGKDGPTYNTDENGKTKEMEYFHL